MNSQVFGNLAIAFGFALQQVFLRQRKMSKNNRGENTGIYRRIINNFFASFTPSLKGKLFAKYTNCVGLRSATDFTVRLLKLKKFHTRLGSNIHIH